MYYNDRLLLHAALYYGYLYYVHFETWCLMSQFFNLKKIGGGGVLCMSLLFCICVYK